MWISPQNPLQKIAIVIYGLVAGVLAAMGTAAGFLTLGIAISLFVQSTGWIHLGEYQPWLPIIGLEYGFVPGVVRPSRIPTNRTVRGILVRVEIRVDVQGEYHFQTQAC